MKKLGFSAHNAARRMRSRASGGLNVWNRKDSQRASLDLFEQV
jgi:hypothetical protein